MKQLSLLSCLFLIMSFTALISDDKKIIKQITSLVSKQEFDKALALFSKVSDAGKNENAFLTPASVVYDSLKMYREAISTYEHLLKLNTEDAGLSTRITHLQNELAKTDEKERERMEKMKSCTKCTGTGFIQTKVVCPACKGTLQIKKECLRCYGQGYINCSGCGGSGHKSSVINGREVEIGCDKCRQEGRLPCSANCDRGIVIVDCRKCTGIGTVTQTVKCDLH